MLQGPSGLFAGRRPPRQAGICGLGGFSIFFRHGVKLLPHFGGGMKSVVTGSSKRALFAAIFLFASLLVFNANTAFASMETLVDGVEAFEEQK